MIYYCILFKVYHHIENRIRRNDGTDDQITHVAFPCDPEIMESLNKPLSNQSSLQLLAQDSSTSEGGSSSRTITLNHDTMTIKAQGRQFLHFISNPRLDFIGISDRKKDKIK